MTHRLEGSRQDGAQGGLVLAHTDHGHTRSLGASPGQKPTVRAGGAAGVPKWAAGVRALTVTAVLGVMLAVTGCSGAGSNDETRTAPTRSGHSVTPTRPSSRPPSGGPHAQQGLPRKVLVVIEENHSLEQMRSGMPFLADL